MNQTSTTSPVLTPQMRAEIEAFFPRYPTKQAVTLPALHVVNEHMRCVPMEAIPEIAAMLELSPAEIYDTLSFYGFFKSAPCGKVRAWVCRSFSCAMRGGEEVLSAFGERLGVNPGETSAGGKTTVDFGARWGVGSW